MHEHELPPLRKEVPGHLLQFEEKIFGMSLTQLLTDLGALFGIIALTASLPLVSRAIIGLLFMTGVLILVHISFSGYPMLYWLYLLGRSHFLPRHAIFRLPDEQTSKGEPGSVQESWIQLTDLEHGMAGVSIPRKNHDEPDAHYWVVFEITSLQYVRLLPEAEQVRIYGRFKQ